MTWYMAIASGDMGLMISSWYPDTATAVNEAIRGAGYDNGCDYCYVIPFEGDAPPALGEVFFPSNEDVDAALEEEGG